MKIFVTGGAGFIGGNFVLKQVLEEDNEILNFDKLTYAGNLDTVQNVALHPRYCFVQGDICDAEVLKRIFSEHKIEAVVHFAGLKAVGESTEVPLHYYRNNASLPTN